MACPDDDCSAPWWSDGELPAAVDQALRAAREVPDGFVAAGRAVYDVGWRHTPGEATLRGITFIAAGLTIELEVLAERMVGQILPPCTGRVEVSDDTGLTSGATVDPSGCFELCDPPVRAFRLYCRTDSGTDVRTGWLPR